VDCCDPCDQCGNWVGHAQPVGRPYAGGYPAGYAASKQVRRAPMYANQDSVKNEFGLDPSVKIVSRNDQVVVPAQAEGVSRTAAQPHRAASRR
jgi:hypothetical protein